MMQAAAIVAAWASIETGAASSLADPADRDGAAMQYLSTWLVDRSALWLSADDAAPAGDYVAETLTRIQMSDLPENDREQASSLAASTCSNVPELRRDVASFDFVAFRKQYFDAFTSAPPPSVNPKDSCSVAGAVARIMSVISSKRFRRGVASDFAVCADDYAARILAYVRAGKPIEFVMPAFPVKCWNPLKVERRGIDLGEVVTLCRLHELCKAVERVYAPGAMFYAIADGLVYAPLFEEKASAALAYRRQLEYLTRLLDIDAYIRVTDMAWLLLDDAAIRTDFEAELPRSASIVAALWRDDNSVAEALQHRDMLIAATRGNANVTDFARPLLAAVLLGRPWTGDASSLESARNTIDERARRCAFNYLVFVRTINEIGVVTRSFPGALRVTCHPKEGQLGLHLVHPSSFNYPWNGVAVVKRTAQARPFRVRLQEEVRSDGRHRAVHLEGDPHPFYYEEIDELDGGDGEGEESPAL